MYETWKQSTYSRCVSLPPYQSLYFLYAFSRGEIQWTGKVGERERMCACTTQGQWTSDIKPIKPTLKAIYTNTAKAYLMSWVSFECSRNNWGCLRCKYVRDDTEGHGLRQKKETVKRRDILKEEVQKELVTLVMQRCILSALCLVDRNQYSRPKNSFLTKYCMNVQ